MTKYFSFEGTATRSEYWCVTLITFITSIILFMILAQPSNTFGGGDLILVLLICVLTFWLGISTNVRRIRDTGQNVLWIIAFFAPFLSFIVMLVFGFLPSHKD